ncbi:MULTISPECIES: IS630 family transposase, partial [unclassified Okeania]|uniref:IS630 family transposase n=1 Tax=unclassified Okeania TaxID=2634635 RepID=UPI00257E78F4
VYPYSQDLRERALDLIINGMSISHVSRLLNISRPTLHQWRDIYLTTGSTVPKANVPPPQISKIKDWEKFEKFVEDNYTQTQKQMAAKWGNCSRFTISRSLKKLGFTRKKTYGYQERDELEREEFGLKLNQIDKKNIVYVDEAGIDNREDYPYGYGVKGKRVPGMKSGKRIERVSWIAAINQSKMFAPLTFTGSCNRDLFENWLENCLLPKLQPGQVIILDNATFHKSVYIEELVAKQGCEIWYLPPYSPDFNKIERWWFVLKNWIKQRLKKFDNFRDCVDAAFMENPQVFP